MEFVLNEPSVGPNGGGLNGQLQSGENWNGQGAAQGGRGRTGDSASIDQDNPEAPEMQLTSEVSDDSINVWI